MPLLSPVQSTANVNPILTLHLLDYVPQEFGWTRLAPIVETPHLQGVTIKFDRSDFRKRNTLKTPGGKTQRRTFSYSDDTYLLKRHRELGVVDKQMLDINQAQGIPFEMEERAVQGAYDDIRRSVAEEVIELAFNTTLYPTNNKVALSGGDKFGGTTSQLMEISRSAHDAIDLLTDRRPNIAVIGFDAFRAATIDPLFVDRIKHTKAPEGYAGEDIKAKLLADLWGVEEVIVDRMKTLADNGTIARNGGDTVIFAYVSNQQNLYVPSAFYTYQWEGYPVAEDMFEEKDEENFLYPVCSYHQVQFTSPEAAYIVTGCV